MEEQPALTNVRRVKRTVVPVPPVCHAFWTPADWARVTVTVEEPNVIEGSSGTWDWTGEYADRDLKLYRRRAG